MIKVTGLNQLDTFIRALDLEMARLDRAISQTFENWTKKVLHEIVETTPQWTGDLATAWTYAVNHIDASYTPIPNKAENSKSWSMADVFSRGDHPAVNIAAGKAMSTHPTWRDVVYIHNPAPIADEVENQTVMIRPINLVDGRVAMVQYYVDKFNRGDLRP